MLHRPAAGNAARRAPARHSWRFPPGRRPTGCGRRDGAGPRGGGEAAHQARSRLRRGAPPVLDTVIWGVAYGIGKAQEKPARRRVAAIVASISRYVQDLRPAFSPAPATVAATAVLAAAAAIAGASAVGLGTSPVPVAEPLAAPAPLDDARTAARGRRGAVRNPSRRPAPATDAGAGRADDARRQPGDDGAGGMAGGATAARGVRGGVRRNRPG